MREQIKKEIEFITPLDSIEREIIVDVLAWIDSGVELCRIEKPDKHLVSYFVGSMFGKNIVTQIRCLHLGTHFYGRYGRAYSNRYKATGH